MSDNVFIIFRLEADSTFSGYLEYYGVIKMQLLAILVF